jgi:hypothetical protein
LYLASSTAMLHASNNVSERSPSSATFAWKSCFLDLHSAL